MGRTQISVTAAGARPPPTYLEQLVNVVAHVVIGQCRVQHLEVGVVHVLEDERRCLGLGIAHNVQ
eukprot:scaffold18772_cov112-Isochrysis_galbana.AAC.14